MPPKKGAIRALSGHGALLSSGRARLALRFPQLTLAAGERIENAELKLKVRMPAATRLRLTTGAGTKLVHGPDHGLVRLPLEHDSSSLNKLVLRISGDGGIRISSLRLSIELDPAQASPPAAGNPIPAPGTQLPQAPSQDPGDLYFAGYSISDFLDQSAPAAVSMVPDPAGSGQQVFKMTVADTDVYPITPTENPRAQLGAVRLIDNGQEYWWSSAFYLPPGFPTYIPDWLTLVEGPYGAPFAGTPPWSIELGQDNMRWQRNSTYDWDVPWDQPYPIGQWVHVLVHGLAAANGYIQMWIDGRPVTFFADDFNNPNMIAPTTILPTATIDASNDSDGGNGQGMFIDSYRKVGMFPSLTIYQSPTLIGSTRAAVGG